MYSSIVLLSLAASVIVNASGLDGRSPHGTAHLERRQTVNAFEAALENLFQVTTAACQTTCQPFISDLETCSALTSDVAIGECACSTQVLSDTKTCADCINADTTSGSNGTLAENDYNTYNAYCQAAISEAGITQQTSVSGSSASSIPASATSSAASSLASAAANGLSSAAAASSALPSASASAKASSATAVRVGFAGIAIISVGILALVL